MRLIAGSRRAKHPTEWTNLMAIDDTTIEELLERAGVGEGSSVGRLLEYHRRKLRRMVAARLNSRLTARIDPSDVVQEALVEAERRLPAYLQVRPVPYLVWLRTIARERLAWWTRQHTTRKRDAFREVPLGVIAPGAMDHGGVDHLVDSGTSPSGRAIREEDRARALALLGRLEESDRRVLELRHLHGLTIAAIASALEIGVGAAQMRYLRALERLRERLDGTGEDSGA
jgi:RNA polymerase sigma-70 factor (ECF subfamily)